MSRFGTGQLACRAGVTIDAVHCFKADGLFSAFALRASGYRRDSNAGRRRLRFIRRNKLLGFTLIGVRRLLQQSAERSVAKIRRVAEAKLIDVEQRMREPERDRDRPHTLITVRPGDGRSEAYTILNTLNEKDSP